MVMCTLDMDTIKVVQHKERSPYAIGYLNEKEVMALESVKPTGPI